MGGRKKREADASVLDFGVNQGEEVELGQAAWPLLTLPQDSILEVALDRSSLGLGAEGWFAVLVSGSSTSSTPGREGLLVEGDFLGSEVASVSQEIFGLLSDGGVHLCPEDPCPCASDSGLLHAQKVRCWKMESFVATYLTKSGEGLLERAREAGKKPRQSALRAPRTTQPRTPPGSEAKKKPRRPGIKAKETVDVSSDLEATAPELSSPASRTKLRERLQQTKERILRGPSRARESGDAGDLAGGSVPETSDSARARPGLVAGTQLNPRRATPLRLAPLEDSRDGDTSNWMKKLVTKDDASSRLLAQALQTTEREKRQRKEKKKKRDKDDSLRALVDLIRGKSKKKKKRKDRDRRGGSDSGESRRVRFKPDPGGSGDPGGSSSSSSSSDDEGPKKDRSDEESELSYEPPLRRRATKSPGSVMEMLVKHAQEQLDRGSLLEAEGAEAGMTTGIKISTYFALLIRPYHPANSALLRELYALAQAIDLLRGGRLPETADALASRFIAVHTALSEGSWVTASNLELFPLEPVASASVGTMLQAHKYRRLVQRSQGVEPSRWSGAGAGKGKGGSWTDKGRKGEPKGKGKTKTKGQGKEGGWTRKGDDNPWKQNQEEAPKK